MWRLLRLSTTVLATAACVLLVAFWIASFLRLDQLIHSRSGSDYFAITSAQGRLMFGKSDDPNLRRFFGPGWTKQGFTWTEWDEKGGGPPCFPASAPVRGFRRIGWLQFSNPFYIHDAAITSFEVIVPYWLLVLPAAALAAVPCIKWRFSLRTLLIAITLL